MCRSALIQGGRVCTVRQSRGDDELAACGQLGGVGELQLSDSKRLMPPVLTPPSRFQAGLSSAAHALSP